jgi:hypothetical protein
VHRSTSGARRACAVGTTIALIGLTTGLGLVTATAASADELADPSTGQTAPTAPADPTADPTPGATPTDPASPTTPATDPSGAPTPGPDQGLPTDTPTAAAPTGAGHGTSTAAPTTGAEPSTLPPSLTAPRATAPSPAATTPTVTITGTPRAGEDLVAKTSGFTAPATFSYVWTVGDVVADETGASYTVQTADIGRVVHVTVTSGTETAEAKTATAIPLAPSFTEGTIQEDPLVLTTVAGKPYSYTFTAAGDPAPEYELDFFDDDEAADVGDGYTPDLDLPDATTFEDGVLTGTPTGASSYTFSVDATNAGGTAKQYVELDVLPATPAGIEVTTGDRDDVTKNGEVVEWIIAPDGAVSTLHMTQEFDEDGNGFGFGFSDPGGQPTIEQGSTLFISGNTVDEFGNYTDVPTDDEGGWTYPTPTVTSDVASDVVRTDPENGDYGMVDVTVHEASTHHLTVADTAAGFATAFDVEVTPTAAVAPVPPVAFVQPAAPAAAPVASAPTSGRQLAYTGSDATNALPWALAMLLAGAGLVGFRTLRRRAQR